MFWKAASLACPIVRKNLRPSVLQSSAGLLLIVHHKARLGHPGGGCRMGTDPKESVCDSYGRTHDHENLFVVGSPTMPAGGYTNGILTLVALSLRSAPKMAETLS